MAFTPQDTIIETPLDKMRRVLKRHRQRADARDQGNLVGIGQIKQMMATKDGDAVRGLLIKLVASGEVEALDCVNGLYWRWYVEAKKIVAKTDAVDGRFILQRELMDEACGRRNVWFDAESFTNRARATAAVEYARWEAEARSADRVGGRVQGIRLVEQAA